jgi:formylglycine-generating enzyme required for sulfatase activity
MEGRKPAYEEKWWDEIKNADGYRLPMNEEWEWAARGGNKSQGFKFSGSNEAFDIGWFRENSNGEIQPVGLKQPNELGLYDMSGNLAEMTNEKMGPFRGTITAGIPLAIEERIWRGGSFSSQGLKSGVFVFQRCIDCPNICRGFADIGFRIVLH